MHMMFVDESGDPGYPKKAGEWKKWGGSKIYVRVGAIILGWKWRIWNDSFVRFKERNGLTWDAEIRASDIRRQKSDFAGWDRSRRTQFMDDLLTIIGGNTNIFLLGVIIEKQKVDLSQRERLKRPEIRSMELLLERYNYFLRNQRDQNGVVVLDTTHGTSDDNIRRFQSYLQARSSHLRPLHIVEGTFFAKSHTSNMIQVADICSNALFRHENAAVGSKAEFKKIYPRFWRLSRRVEGVSIKRWPK